MEKHKEQTQQLEAEKERITMEILSLQEKMAEVEQKLLAIDTPDAVPLVPPA